MFLHQGGEKIAAGDYEFRNRVYSPSLGRWLSNDPLGFNAGDQNWYRAVGNNPVIYFDPSGLWSWKGALGGAIGGAVAGATTGALSGAAVGAGVGAIPGSLIGGGLGFIGGVFFGGAVSAGPGNSWKDKPNTSILESDEILRGLSTGLQVGAIAGLLGPLAYAAWPAIAPQALNPNIPKDHPANIKKILEIPQTTTTVYTSISGPLDIARPLSTSIGRPDLSLALGNSQNNLWYMAKLPNMVVEILQDYNHAQILTCNMNGATGPELKLFPSALRLIGDLFYRIPRPNP